MLKDSLAALMDDVEMGCSVARLRRNFDEETLKAFDQVMASAASTRGIWMELHKEGMSVDRTILALHRHNECKCLKREDAL